MVSGDLYIAASNEKSLDRLPLQGKTVAGIAVAALVVGGALVLYSTSGTQHPPPTGTGSASSTSSPNASPSTSVISNSGTWTVIKSNTTLYYGPACVPVGLFALSCPPISTALHSPSLSNVDVISYRGEELYDMNFTYGFNGQPVTHNVWFTNDTVFCVSPSFDGYALCPTHPVYPTIVVVTPSASAMNPANGLRLDLQLSIATGGVAVTVDVFNTLNAVNNVTWASEWATYSNALRDICDNQVAAFAVYQGNYGAGNFTAASPLVLTSPGAGSICPELSPSVVYSFNPDSGVASAPAGAFAPDSFSRNVTLSDTISGYFTCGVDAPSFRPQNGSGLWICAQNTSKFNPFPPGTYSVVALDQWGDVAVLHFEVYA